MIYAIDKIVRDARVAMGLNAEREQPLFSDCSQLTIDDEIRYCVLDAVREAHLEAPVADLETGHHFGDAVYWAPDAAWGWVLLPEDFLRLVKFEMDDWLRPVYEPIGVSDFRYSLQKSSCAGLRGSPERPVCVLGVRPEGRALEFYSCADNQAQVRHAMYVPEPRIDCDGGIDISERCYRRAISIIASKIRQKQ